MTTRARRRAGLAGAAVIAVVGCTDVPTGADVPFSLEFERLPFPAVVAGDVLRDTTGAPAPLAASAYNVDGDAIASTPIRYLLVGDAAVLESGAVVRGVTAGDTTSVTAIAGDVPSLPQTLWVVPRPDTLAGPTAPPDTVRAGTPPATLRPVEVRLFARAGGTPVPVRSWVLRYRLIVRGDTLAPSDTALVWLVDDQGRPSAIDTTDAGGVAARRVRVNGLNPAIDALDSVVVSVTALGLRTPVAGSPVRVALPVRRR